MWLYVLAKWMRHTPSDSTPKSVCGLINASDIGSTAPSTQVIHSDAIFSMFCCFVCEKFIHYILFKCLGNGIYRAKKCHFKHGKMCSIQNEIIVSRTNHINEIFQDATWNAFKSNSENEHKFTTKWMAKVEAKSAKKWMPIVLLFSTIINSAITDGFYFRLIFLCK